MSPDCLLRWTALCVVLSMLCSSAAGQTINVLFLGNSYTSTGGLPSVFQQLAQAGGHTGVAGGASACALFGAHSGSFDICSVFSLSLSLSLFFVVCGKQSVTVDSYAPGGLALGASQPGQIGHFENPTSLARIDQGGWDYLVLQDQSYLPTV